MRLTDHEVASIKAAAREAFGEAAVVRLFGSRVDDGLRGGDIDLHVELPEDATDAISFAETPFRRMLWRALDMSEIDVVIKLRGSANRWIDDAAYRTGIVL